MRSERRIGGRTDAVRPNFFQDIFRDIFQDIFRDIVPGERPDDAGGAAPPA